MITLYINGLKTPKKRHMVSGSKNENARAIYMLPPRDSLQTYAHLPIESEGMEKIFTTQIDVKVSQNSNAYIVQTRL